MRKRSETRWNYDLATKNKERKMVVVMMMMMKQEKLRAQAISARCKKDGQQRAELAASGSWLRV